MPHKVSHVFYSLIGTAVFEITRLWRLRYMMCCFCTIMRFISTQQKHFCDIIHAGVGLFYIILYFIVFVLCALCCVYFLYSASLE